MTRKVTLKPLELENLFEEAKRMKPNQKLTAKQMDEFNERAFQ